MATKFFNNENGDTLFAKFTGIAEGMGANFHTFQAVSGYFRSSGYFKLRRELKSTQKIQVLVGINIDNVFRKSQREGMMFLGDKADAKRQYTRTFVDDVRAAGYTKEIEDGIVQLCDDVVSGKLELRVHSSRNLHAKFYLCLPEKHGPNTDGWVIMGSSNLTDSGLGTSSSPRYELNVAMKDYDDVAYCKAEFDRLWCEGVPVSADDIAMARKQTHLGQQPTPFEIFMRVLIDIYGSQVEDEFSMDLPSGVTDLKYQRDAVVQGYQMLCRYDGFFLSDVVGLGKTVVATMIARRFSEANGKTTRILVVHPPAVEQNWKETFKTFGLSWQTQFVSSGSLHKVLEGLENYRAPDEFDLVIVDESHNFRNSSTIAFDQLQRICKSPRPTGGFLDGNRKKVMLLSATPLNNSPQDILNQILLFQDARRSTIDGVPNIGTFFAPLLSKYKKIMAERQNGSEISVKEVDALYERMRREVIEKITIRRTRSNIMNEPDYAADLKAQGVVFPRIEKPHELVYFLDDELDALFWNTLDQLKTKIQYARYRAIEFLKDPKDSAKYGNAAHVAQTLAGVYKVHMVKRLESSFYAFKKSVATLLRITEDMLSMLAKDKVLIIPDMNVTDYLEKGMELEVILDYARKHGLESASFPASAFRSEFGEMLELDRSILRRMQEDWSLVDRDPKFDEFRNILKGELFGKTVNPTGKLVVFSESVDTLTYLKDRITAELERSDVLLISSANRKSMASNIRSSFDANATEKSNAFNIILASDVLAEGINLHRANVIVNYDTPWNATRLMQRIGRVNRIGSVAEKIHSYMFHPSKQGDRAIGLYQNSVIKLQGFHSALGEDSQIFSHEEMLRTFMLFDADVKDSVDESLRYLRLARQFRKSNPALYNRVRHLPMKCRVLRKSNGEDGGTVAYFAAGGHRASFFVKDGCATEIGCIEALKRMESELSEPALDWTNETRNRNYGDVSAAQSAYENPSDGPVETVMPSTASKNKVVASARHFLRDCSRWIGQGGLDARLQPVVKRLDGAIADGKFVHLDRALSNMAKTFKTVLIPSESQKVEIAEGLGELHAKYCKTSAIPQMSRVPSAPDVPELIVSETFV